MKHFIVPIILAFVGVLVMAVALRYYIHDSIYIRGTGGNKRYLAPNVSYLILAGIWIVLSIYLAATIFIQLS